MPDRPRVVPAILSALNQEVLGQLALASSIEHPGESGRAREQIIGRFLRRLVPDGYGISTGFVIDAVGGISRQIDLVIFRTGYHPVFEIGGVNHFLIESVAAVIENKASVESAAVLDIAIQNIESVKALDRSNRGTNYVFPLAGGRPMLNADDFQHQVFGAIITERSLAEQTLVRHLLGFFRNRSRRVWPNVYVDVHKFAIEYATGDVDALTATAVPSERLLLEPADQGGAPLLTLAYELINYLRVAPLVDFSSVDYLHSRRVPIRSWSIKTEPADAAKHASEGGSGDSR